jgi:hypothetical protein
MRGLRIEMNKHAGEACCCRGLLEFIIKDASHSFNTGYAIRGPNWAQDRRRCYSMDREGLRGEDRNRKKPGVSVTGPLTPVIHRG